MSSIRTPLDGVYHSAAVSPAGEADDRLELVKRSAYVTNVELAHPWLPVPGVMASGSSLIWLVLPSGGIELWPSPALSSGFYVG
jgi:hypothetical protein